MSKNIQRRPITALELRCTAGCAPERRGSALLIVIGTLALVAVFAAVYVSIGRTDRRAANALKTRIEQRDNSIQAGEYLAGVIGDDRLDAFVQYDLNLQPFGRREVTDAPYTDWTRRSEVDAGEEHLLFTPWGGPFEMSGSSAMNDYRVANDPWLASTTPTFLGKPGDPSGLTGTDERPFSNYEVFSTAFPNSKNFLDQRDWLQISNFAPDGRPVNLFNLRPNAGFDDNPQSGPFGRFDSEPGFGTSQRTGDRPIRRMSNYLSLLKQEVPGDPESLIQAFDPAVDGVWIPGYNDPQNVGLSGLDLYNTPAVWTMYQRFMLMPMNQPFVIKNRQGDESSWADPDFPYYQYADADGDGFADSRWFELRSARVASEGTGTDNREDIQSLFEQGDYRYFIAARAVDLSSMVNVNTATDQLVPPTLEYPLGLTPADVDLRRLLTMQDQAGDYTAFLTTGGAGTSGISLSMGAAHRPYIANDEPQYGPTTPNGSAAFEERNVRRDVVDYWNYKHQWNTTPQDPRDLASDSTAMLIGRYAYDAIKRSINLGGTLTNDYKGYDLEWAGVSASARTDLLQYQVDPLDISPIPPQISQEKRFEQYMRVGRLDPINNSLSTAVTDASNAYGSGLYGLDDLTELLTYHGLNDPDFTSRLERVADGRYSSPFTGANDDTLQTRRLGPLFSNRPLSLDRFQHGLALTDITQNPNTPPTYDNPGLREVNGRVSFNSMAMMTLSPRRRLTTVSGFVPISPDERLTDAAVPTALNGASVLQPLSDVVTNPNQLFGIYAGALAGEVGDVVGTNWTDPDQYEVQNFSTLFYGHRGPELSLRIAAHAAVNMADLADSDSEVSVATLLVDSQRRTDLNNQNNLDDPETDSLYQLYPGAANGVLLDVDPNDTIPLPNNGLPTARQLVNVYGVEATPVITEVSTMYIYHDTAGMRLGGPGDEDYDTTIEPRPQGTGLVRVPADGDPPNITIHGARDTNNPDYLGQVLAFQLHNPYGVSISLGGDGLGSRDPLARQRNHDDETTIDQASNYQFDYYIEFAGRFYKLAEYIEWYPTDENGENFYEIDDPMTTDAYGSIPNPQSMYPAGSVGGYMQPGTEASSSTPAAGDYMNQAPYSDFITRNVVLQPGETRVFYVLAEKRFDDPTPTVFTDSDALDDKWARTLNYYGDLNQNFQVGGRDADLDGLPDGAYADSRGWTGPAEQWVRKQLHVRRQDFPIMMMEFDPRDGKLLNETFPGGAVPDPTINAPSPLFANRNDTNEVRLWKKVTTTGEETDEQDNSNTMINPTYRNLIQNDLLVDRLELPESLAMDANLAGMFPVGTDVANTVSYRDDLPRSINGRQIRNDNTGITVVNWKSIRRVDSETADLVDRPELGEVTPWMLRSLGNIALTPIVHTSDLTSGAVIDGTMVVENNSTTLAETPITTDFETYATLRDLVDVAATTNGEEIIQTLALEPHFKSDPENDPSGLIEDDTGNRTIAKFMPKILPVMNTAIEDRDAIVFTGGDEPISDHPRLADLLLAWGIGPSFSPDPLRAANATDYVPTEWQTLSEAMSEVLGFNLPGMIPPDESRSVWQSAWDTTTQQGILDGGRLALDRYVSFINDNPMESPIEFTVGNDLLRGSGVPMALGVIDRARAIEPLQRVTDPINPSGPAMTELELTRPTFGTININTAPVEVLRLLPGLSPSRASYASDAFGATIEREWWGANPSYMNLALPDLDTTGADVLTENPDVAAAIVAYRDRIFGYPNTGAHPNAAAASNNYFDLTNPNALYFSVNDNMLNLESVANNYLTEDPVNNLPASAVTSMDRRTFTGIDGLRLTPGFGSLGELLAVQADPEFATSNANAWTFLRHLSIQQLGYDARAQGIVAGPAGEITILPQVFGSNSVGATVDDYAEKLAMADSVVNMLSVRSDYYAVWFVLQGYKESDVANLRPEDPLIPSVHKRYLMVVDRSNVVEPGDKPKIVLLKEVPL